VVALPFGRLLNGLIRAKKLHSGGPGTPESCAFFSDRVRNCTNPSSPAGWLKGTPSESRGCNKLLTIMRSCGDNHILVRQIKSLRFKEFKGAFIDKDPPSDPMDKDRHLIDCVSYILLDSAVHRPGCEAAGV
jgi:hypothetical protein